MARSVFVQTQSEVQFPMFWRNLLVFVAVGKAAIAGTGLALAGLGALDIAFAITANDWLQEIQREYVNYVALGGGAVGAVGALIRAIFFR